MLRRILLLVIACVLMTGATVAVKDCVRMDLSMYYNIDGISWKSDNKDGDLDGVGNTYIADLFPKKGKTWTIKNKKYGSILFSVLPAGNGKKNFISFNNQKIKLKGNQYKKLFLLITAVNGNQTGNIDYTWGDTFSIGRKNAADGDYFAGSLADVRIYAHALTQTEITRLYTESTVGEYSEDYSDDYFKGVESEIALSGEVDFAGAYRMENPAWLILDATLTWMGEWDATWSYDIDDVVLHKANDEWHVFVSKIGHNVGNIPTISPVAWHRLYQEQQL